MDVSEKYSRTRNKEEKKGFHMTGTREGTGKRNVERKDF
jgi:hypothetical protein